MQNSAPMQQFVQQLLADTLPTIFYYHNYNHAVEVQRHAAEIGAAMHCTDNELYLLDMAALWHDTGFIINHIGHEELSCQLAQQYLPQFGISENDIAIVCSIIMATKMPTSPSNLLQQIIADADVAYLGSPLAATRSEDLFKELQAIDKSLSKPEWDKTQVDFLSTHQFYTSYCRYYKEPVKQAYLATLLVKQ
jgi:uncharacterized protein